MLNLFQRMKNTVMSDLHEALDKKEKKNPIGVLNHYLRQCEQEVEKVRKLVERQYLLKKEFQKEHQEASVLAEKRKYQAEVASKANEEGLYEFARQEQTYYEERSVRIRESMLQAGKELEELERKYGEMKHKLKDMYIKRMELMGRENIARAHHKMNAVLESSSGYDNQSFSKFGEIETYLDQLEHGVNSSYYRNTIDAKIAKLEKDVKNEETEAIPS
ncbi:PspA/IM30 family protein [Bacillus sp. KH172YL63]|uniref:PspA/IM30 family protein n=1 Tax=Bacillus sp. KH172YL63 TaxID=2709784 RepID=UPI0013E48F75|nr:PspA/IM30 family protein [Bacillus sp. KH172YL63]BCB02382.1 phage shock protein A [Bacillus sp. KH172YL63]